MQTILKVASAVILLGLMAGCADEGPSYGSGYGYSQPYGYPYGYSNYSAPTYSYGFSYYGGDNDAYWHRHRWDRD